MNSSFSLPTDWFKNKWSIAHLHSKRSGGQSIGITEWEIKIYSNHLTRETYELMRIKCLSISKGMYWDFLVKNMPKRSV